VLVGAVVAVLILAGLTVLMALTPGRATAAPPPFRSFTVGVQNMQVTTLNPLSITLLWEYVIVYNIYSTLITYDKNYNVKPDLAYEWSVAPDQVTWTFHLVDGAYFTDPTNPADRSHPVTADDVVFSYNLNRAETGSIYNSYTTEIASITALDSRTVQIVTKKPFAAMNSTASAIPILPKYIWGGIKNPVHYANSVPVGSGAMYYDVTNTTFGSNIILRRNPNYYGDRWYCQFSRPDQVYFKDYLNSASMLQDFKSGASGLDAIVALDPPDYKQGLPYDPTGRVEKWAVDTGFVGEISINVMTRETAAQFGYRYSHSDLTLNETFRKAVAMSINKQALVDYALLGLGIPADTLVPSSNPWHYDIPADEEFPFDPQAARQMLMDAGWKYDAVGNPAGPTQVPLYQAGGQNPLQIRFYTLNTLPQWQLAAQNITAWLAQAGIQTLDSRGRPGYSLMTINQMSTAWFSADYDMWLWDWIFTPASDPSIDILEVETTQAIGPTSDNYYSNATYDELYNRSLTTIDPAERRAITDEMQRMIYFYASYILPYYRLDLYAATNGRPNVPAGGLPGWTNYGNWSEEPGLVPDSDLPNLWFQLEPLDNRPPSVQSFPTVSWISGDPAPITLGVVDPEGQTLNLFWDFGDGTFANTTTGSVTHVYAQPGIYQIQVRVSDAEWPVCASTVATIVPPSPQANLPPTARLEAVSSSLLVANTEIPFNLTVRDREGDPIYVTWNFGDGATATNYVTNTLENVTVQQKHAYATEGTYTVRIVYTDNKTGVGAHTGYINSTLVIRAAAGPGGGGVAQEFNPWLNYGVPLGILAVIVAGVLAVIVRRRRLARKEEKPEEAPPGGPPPPPPTP